MHVDNIELRDAKRHENAKRSQTDINNNDDIDSFEPQYVRHSLRYATLVTNRFASSNVR
jgi:hypothetical protein